MSTRDADGRSAPWSAWALPLLLCSGAVDRDAPHPLDRIRVQKAVFLLVQRGPGRWRRSYDYQPYNWGPYCRELADDLRRLTEMRLLRPTQFQGARYKSYAPTPEGQLLAQRLREELSTEELGFIDSVRTYVTSVGFNDLLRDVYDAYPGFATKSKWAGNR
jgi:hypothetical protein